MDIMKHSGYFAWILLIIAGTQPALANHNGNDTVRGLWDDVYSEYVCETLDGYLWLAEACTFPVRKALDYYLKYGDNTNDLYDHVDNTFNNVPVLTLNVFDNETLETYLYDYESIFGDTSPYDFSGERICTDYMTLARDCMSHYFVNCSNTLSNDIDGYMNSYKSQYCEDNNDLKEYITMQKGVFREFLTGNSRRARCPGMSDFYDQLVSQTVCTDSLILDSPYAPNDQNITNYVDQEPDDFLTARQDYTSDLRTSFRCMENEMREMGCPTSEAQSLVVYMYSFMMPPGIDYSLQEAAAIFVSPEEEGSLTTGDEADLSRSTAGMFGNGHLMKHGRTDDFDRQVCSMRRRWTDLAINKYIQLKGLPAFETATAFGAVYMSAVELVFLDGSGTVLIEYSTSGSTISTDVTVVDSKTQVVDEPDNQYVALEEVTSHMVELTNPLGDVAVTISQYNDVYAVWVRMYDEDWDRTYGVLIDGCDEEMDQEDILGYDPTTGNSRRRRRRRRDVSDVCQDACEDAVSEPAFEPCCELDCTVNGEDTDQATGNSDMAASSLSATDATDSALVSNLRSHACALRPNTPLATALMLIFMTYLLSKM